MVCGQGRSREKFRVGSLIVSVCRRPSNIGVHQTLLIGEGSKNTSLIKFSLYNFISLDLYILRLNGGILNHKILNKITERCILLYFLFCSNSSYLSSSKLERNFGGKGGLR